MSRLAAKLAPGTPEVAFAGAALHGQRRLAGACETCGRRSAADRWTSPDAAARWGAWATWTAVLLPFFYSVTRWAWPRDIPLGVTSEFLREEAEETPMIWYAARSWRRLARSAGC